MCERSEMYAKAIQEKGAPLDNCVGFIDCTKIAMARPGGHGALQRALCSRQKRMRCLIYQTVTTPDGLMLYMYGPEVGRRHDLTLYRESRPGEVLETILSIDGKQFCIFVDAAFLLRPWLQTAFPSLNASAQDILYNKAIGMVRVAVECTYKDVKQLRILQDSHKGLTVRQAPIVKLYHSTALLWNFHVCMYRGGQTKSSFELEPPALAAYINSE